MRSPHHTRIACLTVCQALEPLFRQLSNDALLKQCSDGIVQNSNESLHAMIWDRVPKNQHALMRSTERGVAEAISRFNQGIIKNNAQIPNKLGYSAGTCLVHRSLENDKSRLLKSQKEHLVTTDTKTRLAKRHKPSGDPAYSPGLL